MMRLIAMHVWFLDELVWTTGHQLATLTPEAVDLLMTFDHFGFATLSPKGIRRYFAQTRVKLKRRRAHHERHGSRNSVKPRGDVFAPLRGRGGHQKGRGRRGRAALKGITNETHAGCDL
jgi:hypothetical protein